MHRQSEERLADCRDVIFHLILPDDRSHRRALLSLTNIVISASHKKAGRDDRVRIFRMQHITRQLQSHELVVWQIAIERLDQPITISP